MQQLEAQLKVAELPARDAQQVAGRGQSGGGARPMPRRRSADLADRTIVAPAAGRVERLFFDAGEMAAAGAPVVSLLPAEALKVKFYVAEAERPALRARRARGGQLRRLRRRADGDAQLFRLGAAVHAAGHLFARRAAAADLPGRGDARRRRGAAAGPAGDGRAAANERRRRSSTCTGLTKRFGDKRVVDDFDIQVPQGRDLRLSRAQRLGQDDDDPHALRPADAGRAARARASASTCGSEAAADQGAGRLHDAEVLATTRISRSARTSISWRACTGSTGASSGSTQALDDLGLADRAKQLAGYAVGRLEAAAGARGVPAARAATAAARRADRRRRSQGAARLLGRDPAALGAAASRCWSRPTTWTRRCSATSSPTSPTARS